MRSSLIILQLGQVPHLPTVIGNEAFQLDLFDQDIFKLMYVLSTKITRHAALDRQSKRKPLPEMFLEIDTLTPNAFPFLCSCDICLVQTYSSDALVDRFICFRFVLHVAD